MTVETAFTTVVVVAVFWIWAGYIAWRRWRARHFWERARGELFARRVSDAIVNASDNVVLVAEITSALETYIASEAYVEEMSRHGLPYERR